MQPFISGRVGEFLADLKTLVNIDSGSDHITGIDAVARFLEPRLAALGFSTTLERLGERGVPCLRALNRPLGETRDILFLGHMDTVFPLGEAGRRPFVVDGHRATGPGVCDMKGGLVVVLHVLEALHHAGLLDNLAVGVCFNGDEEVGSGASREWIETHAAGSHRVFVFEPCRPGHRFVLQRKGGGTYTITASGTAAHAGVEPERGANAAVEIAHQVIAVQAFNEGADAGVSAHVTVLSAGERTNIIPHTARATVDVRVASRHQRAQVESFFQSLPDRARVPGVTVAVQGSVDRPPMEADDRSRALWTLIQETAAAMGLPIDSIATGGCSDGNFTSALGVPTIDGMGLIGANAHREDEYVEVDSIVPQVHLVAAVCEAIARAKG